jgi:hypothetical protein
MKIKIALEWFLNPNHLPFILGITTKTFQQAGLFVDIIEPSEHYDGFESLKNGKIDIHVNEPIHLFEHYFEELKSLGCFFDTRGGVMIKKESIEKLKTNQHLKITTPASNEVTNRVGFEILSRYATANNFKLDIQNVEFIQTDFYHLKNLQEGDFDGAWLCFYNFEGIEAEYLGFENLFIDQFNSPYPNFSALELMTTKEKLRTNQQAIRTFINISEKMIKYAKDNPKETKTAFYDYTSTTPNELMDKIIDDTIKRFYNEISPNPIKWRKLYEMLEEFGFCDLDAYDYNQIWKV